MHRNTMGSPGSNVEYDSFYRVVMAERISRGTKNEAIVAHG